MLLPRLQARILNWPRTTKRWVAVTSDVFLAFIATWIAFSLRLDAFHKPEGLQWVIYVLSPLLSIPIFIKFGLYRAIFRYTGLAALLATVQAIALYGLIFAVAIIPLHAQSEQGMPRSLGLLQPLIFLLLVGASRAGARLWLAGISGRRRHAPHRLLIYGAGDAAVQAANGLANVPTYRLLGFVDDAGERIGQTINGVDVFSPAAIPQLINRLGITDILLALPAAQREQRNRILRQLDVFPVHVRTLPGLADLASGKVSIQDFRELDVEDLLGRDPIPPLSTLFAGYLRERVVLITGAGGSIGSELARQVLQHMPTTLLILDHSEFALYTIEEELRALASRSGVATSIVVLLASVTDNRRMRRIFDTWRPAVVYHAAAYKHVPMVEHNPVDGVRNNVYGTWVVATAARRTGTERFILVSTDKAVRPTNLMGASKRVAELILQALDAQACDHAGDEPDADLQTDRPSTAQRHAAVQKTKFAMVRFGNVLGSSGSVVPLFRRQLANGGPLTVTHEDVTRYFMTISEAVQLVIQAGAMAEGGDVFLLDMGDPVRIIDLARRMTVLSGLSIRDQDHPDGDIELQITGLRPGEKLYEELLIGENPLPTDHPRIMKAREARIEWPELAGQLRRLLQACDQDDIVALRDVLASLANGAPAVRDGQVCR